MNEFGQLQQQIVTWEAERGAKKIRHAWEIEEIMKATEADKEAFRLEIQSMLQATQGQPALQQVLVMQNLNLWKLVIEWLCFLI